MKGEQKLRKSTLIFMVILLSSSLACGLIGKKDKSSELGISGKLGSSYTASKSHLEKNSKTGLMIEVVSSAVDTVVALPVDIPFKALPEIMTEAVTVPINADGSFNITVDTSRSWILLLVDSTKARKDQIVSFAALGDSNALSDSMILLPAGDAVSDINMGTLEISGDEGVQADSMSENESSFSLNISDLRQIAQNDNILKIIKNIYVNYDAATGKYYSAGIAFNWDGSTDLAKNQFSDPDKYIFSGYQPFFDSRNDTNFPYAGVKDKSFIVKIVPPSAVTDSNDVVYSDFSSACDLTEMEQGSNSWTLFSNTPPFAFNINYNFDPKGWIQITASGLRFKNLVSGWWSLQKDNVEVAAFDLAVTNPIRSVTGKPFVYLPSLKINVDASDVITSFEIKWYHYNAVNAQYEEVTDTAGFNDIIDIVGMSYVDLQSPRNAEDFRVDNPTSGGLIYPKKAWKLTGTPSADTSGAYDVFSISLYYRVYGVIFGINLRP